MTRDPRDFIDGQAVFFAGTANTIMQLGRPEVGYGVIESKVDDGAVTKVPRKRFRTTVTYLAVALLGTDEERAAYRRAVNRQHRQVRSDEHSPVDYNAFLRELQGARPRPHRHAGPRPAPVVLTGCWRIRRSRPGPSAPAAARPWTSRTPRTARRSRPAAPARPW